MMLEASTGSSPHTWGIPCLAHDLGLVVRFIPTYVGHTRFCNRDRGTFAVHPHIRGAYLLDGDTRKNGVGSSPPTWGIRRTVPKIPRFRPVHPHLRGAYLSRPDSYTAVNGSSPPTWGIHWTAVRKMAGFSHFSYDFTRKSYFVQGLVFFGVIGAEAFPTHRRGRSQCLPGAHGGSVRNL